MIGVPIEDLRDLLICDAEGGALTWRERPREMFATDKSFTVWNKRFAGKRALNASNGKGYLRGMVNWRKMFAHRVIWAMHYGAWPVGEIDHINGDKADNRIVNLRDVSHGENTRNAAIRRDNRTGAVGVFKVGERYAAYIRSGKRRVDLGRHASFDEALSARRVAERKLGFHENHGRRTA